MMMQAVLGNPSHPEYGVATIPFPIPHDQYAHCMDFRIILDGIYRHTSLLQKKMVGWNASCADNSKIAGIRHTPYTRFIIASSPNKE